MILISIFMFSKCLFPFRDQSFYSCGKIVDVDAFISKCLDTTCNCLLASKGVTSAEENCRCEALTNFVQECLTADNQQELLDWRSRHDCRKLFLLFIKYSIIL